MATKTNVPRRIPWICWGCACPKRGGPKVVDQESYRDHCKGATFKNPCQFFAGRAVNLIPGKTDWMFQCSHPEASNMMSAWMAQAFPADSSPQISLF